MLTTYDIEKMTNVENKLQELEQKVADLERKANQGMLFNIQNSGLEIPITPINPRARDTYESLAVTIEW